MNEHEQSDDYPDGKYVIFKKDEFEQWLSSVVVNATPGTRRPIGILMLQDAVVIRLQDIFAAPALDTYANSIAVAVQAMKLDQPYNSELVKRMQALADYFHRQAEEAREIGYKVPD